VGRRGKKPTVHGVVVLDKPGGPTSHDLVSKARKALNTRAVGHAGTLDPMATGVLVLAIGEGTKLVPYLTADDKSYAASLVLGVATDSLDADGEETARAPVPSLTLEAVQEAARSFLGPHQQRAPKVSAIRVDGKRLHERVRAGEEVEAPLRDVVLYEVEVTAVEGARILLELRAAKGFYVRSFGRDLAEALGTVGHLDALRRTASGRFTLEDATPLEALGPESLMPLAEAAARVMPCVAIDDAAAEDARHGRPVRDERAAGEGVVGLLHGGALVAIASRAGDAFHVARGIRY